MSQVQSVFRHIKRSKVRLDPVHLTALTYLCEALREERYEEIGEMLGIMRQIGVRESLIGRVIRQVV